MESAPKKANTPIQILLGKLIEVKVTEKIIPTKILTIKEYRVINLLLLNKNLVF